MNVTWKKLEEAIVVKTSGEMGVDLSPASDSREEVLLPEALWGAIQLLRNSELDELCELSAKDLGRAIQIVAAYERGARVTGKLAQNLSFDLAD